jgi:hypothetical protein
MKEGVNGLMQERRSDWGDHANHACCAVRRCLGRAVHAVIILTVLLILPGTLRAKEGRSYLDVGVGYKTGSFGTPFQSNLGYFSTGLGYATPVYDVSITIPYLFLSSESQSGTQSTNGIGDIIIRGDRVLVDEKLSDFSLDGAIAVKLPSADDTKGLGTGQTDFGAFLNAHQRLADVKFSLLGGYIKVGSPSNVTYNDVYLYGLGISKVFGFTELYGSFEGRRAAISSSQNPQEIHAGIFHVLNKDYAIKGSTFVGLNNGGPSFGFDAGVVRWF